jgi:hypothetical protein
VTCPVCLKWPARWRVRRASLRDEPAWVVCDSCRKAGVKHRADVVVLGAI